MSKSVGKSRAGRKPIAIDKTQLETLMRLYPSIDDTAAFFKCKRDTIIRFIKKNYGVEFATFREQNMVHTRFNLKRRAIHEATKDKPNTAMLIFCLKNLCDWRDHFPDDGPPVDDGDMKFTLSYTLKPDAPKPNGK